MIFVPNVETILGEFGIREQNNRKKFMRMKEFIRKCMDSYYEAEEDIEQEEESANSMEDSAIKYTLVERATTKRNIFNKVEKWVDDAALFVFGFLMYKICKEIKELNKEEGERPEDEIWITSFGSLKINRLTRSKNR